METKKTGKSNKQKKKISKITKLERQSSMFIKVEKFDKKFNSNNPASYLNNFLPGEPIESFVSWIIRSKYDIYYEGQISSVIFSDDQKRFPIGSPSFTCSVNDCYSLKFSMDDILVLSENEGTIGIESLFALISSFGGLHSVLSILISTFILNLHNS